MPSVASADYRFDLGAQYLALKQGKFSLTPGINLSAGQSQVDDFTESNPTDPLQALHVHGQNNTSIVAGVALNGAYSITSQIDLTAGIGVSQELDHSYRDVTANVVNDGGTFTVRSAGLGDTEYNLGIGVNYNVTKLLRLSLSYQAGFSTDQTMSNAIFLGVSVSF
jgi:outer membrane autotransporter protein